jgi:predicted RNase H-like nuclease (RuvC/YqgF family)
VEYPERREVGGRVPLGASGPEGRHQSPGDPAAEDITTEIPSRDEEDSERDETDAEVEELRRRLGEKDRHIEELYDDIAAARVAADGATAKAEAGELRVGDLEEERARLKERISGFEEEERRRRRRREGQDRRVSRLQREIERREAEIQRLQDLLEEKDRETETREEEIRVQVSRGEAALEDALRRIELLQRDLQGRDIEARGLRAEPVNRLRAGVELFNGSEHLTSVDELSQSLGRPEVYVTLGEEGDEPPVVLTFIWGGDTWRTYAANPGLAAEEPRVRQLGGTDPSSIDRELPNAHLDPDGRVVLGL